MSAKEYQSHEPIWVRFELTNNGNEDVYVLKWYTPLEGLNSDCLQVVRNGTQTVPYDGRLAKRGKPDPADYVLVPAKQTISVDVDISESYHVSVPGEYDVSLRTTVRDYVSRVGNVDAATALSARVQPPSQQKLQGGRTHFKVLPGPQQRATRGQAARAASKAKAAAKPLKTVTDARIMAPIFNDDATAAQIFAVTEAHLACYNLCEASLVMLSSPVRRAMVARALMPNGLGSVRTRGSMRRKRYTRRYATS